MVKVLLTAQYLAELERLRAMEGTLEGPTLLDWEEMNGDISPRAVEEVNTTTASHEKVIIISIIIMSYSISLTNNEFIILDCNGNTLCMVSM